MGEMGEVKAFLRETVPGADGPLIKERVDETAGSL